MLKKIAVLFGVILLAVGILGFVPAVSPNDHLFGLFHVNTVHNLIHIITGVVALGVGCCCCNATRLFFQVFGVIYGLVAVLGFFNGYQPIFGLIANNYADAILHVIIAAFSLYLGFFFEDREIA